MIEIHPTVWVYNSYLKNSDVIIESIEKAIEEDITLNWKYATAGSSYDSTIQNLTRTNKTVSITDSMKFGNTDEELDKHLFDALTIITNEYATNYGLSDLVDEGYHVLKYDQGTQYKQHFDCGGNDRNRVLSMVAYLNDDYVGGELEFPFWGVKYKPSAGDVVFFPSCYSFSHTALPVEEGTKYALVTWLAYA